MLYQTLVEVSNTAYISTILFPFIIRGQGDEQSGLEENEEVSSFFNLLTH